MNYRFVAFSSLCLLSPMLQSQLLCEDSYTCYEDSSLNIIWVKKDDGNVNGPDCQSVCEDALLNNANIFHSCDQTQPLIHDMDSFSDIATGLGISCNAGGCWDSISPNSGLILVSKGTNPNKTCYFPTQTDNENEFLLCDSSPGNANCYGERYSTICPCVAKPLDEACVWSNPPHVPSVADWGNNESTSCIDRINYWRKRACDEEWVECPPSGLPPMTECTCCHECANSQAEYDKSNGAHASFKRCGDMSQGEAGGGSCASVIDTFVSERSADENGTMRCTGHCGPIVSHGCNTFFWGQYDGFYTLNWRTCNTETCYGYCSDPTDNACFSSSDDIAPDIGKCENVGENVNDTGASVGLRVTFMCLFGLLVSGILFSLLWGKYRGNVDEQTEQQTA